MSHWKEAASWTVMRMVDILSTDDCQLSYYWEGCDVDPNPNADDGSVQQRKIRQLNRYRYQFGDVLTAPFYTAFLAPDVRAHTHRLGNEDRFGQFRAWFRLPLHMIQDIAEQFIYEGYVHATR